MIWNVPVPVIYEGVFYEVDVIKSITQVNTEDLNTFILAQINKLKGLDNDTVLKIIKEELANIPNADQHKADLKGLEDKIMIQIGDINNKIDGINIKIGDIEKILEGFKDGAPGLPGEDGKDAIVNGITNRILKKLKEDKDYETPLNNISEFLQLLVITKQLIVDTLFMMRNNGGVGGDRGGMRKAAIDDNTGKISRNIKRLNEIEVMSIVNPLVDDVNKLLANFTATPGGSDRIIPMDITPLYAKDDKTDEEKLTIKQEREQKVAAGAATRTANIATQDNFDDAALGEALTRREDADKAAQEAKEIAEKEKQRQDEAAQRATAESAKAAAEEQARRAEEERQRQEAEAAANAAKQEELRNQLAAIKTRLDTKLKSLQKLLDKKITYKEYIDAEENKPLRQLLELYSKVKDSVASNNKYQVNNQNNNQLGGNYNYNYNFNNYYQTGGFGFYQIGGNFEGAAKEIRNVITMLSPEIETVYGHWKDNTKIEGGGYDDAEYIDILSKLKTKILGGRSEQELETQLMGWREEILKIPGIVVKVTDWFKDISKAGYNSDSNKGYVDVIGDTCLSVGDDASVPNCGKYQKYGPFRYAVGPSENKNPTNSDVFKYLTAEDKYNLGNVLANPGQDVKLFGYGFSGSGKTYTLLQGSPTDKSLFVQTLELVNSTPGLEFADNAIGVDIFYPMVDKKATKDKVFAKSSPIGKEMSEKLEQFRKSLDENKEKATTNPQDIISGLEGIENTLLDYLLVLPTSNNPRSSRAFTIVSINLSNGSSIKFIDLPGLEKKVDMIRDHYYPTKSSEDIKKAIGNKGGEKVSSKVTINGFGGFYDDIKGSVIVQKASGDAGGNKIDKFTYDSKTNTKNYEESLIIGLKNSYLQKNAFNNFDLKLKITYTDLLKEYLIKLICFTNYQYALVEGYTYTLPKTEDITSFIKNFKNAFLGNGNKKPSTARTASEKVYKDIMENVFNLDYADTNTKIGLDSIKGTFVSPILDILHALIEYLEAERKVRIGSGSIKEDDKKNAILLFMIMFTQFTLEQGDAIVTSLEHLLFEFLNQIPDGINKFNAVDGVTPFTVTGAGSKAKYSDRSFTISSSSGMTETVNSTYLQGMHDVLDIGENSRFINLLTILRRKKSEIDTNKRCQGARDTLEFGETLVQSNASLCGEKGALKGKDSEIISEMRKIQAVKDTIPTGTLTADSVGKIEKATSELGLRKYRRNVRNNNDACSLM